MNHARMKRPEAEAGGPDHAARFSPKVRFAVVLGCAALALFLIAEITARLLERASGKAASAAPPPSVVAEPQVRVAPALPADSEAREQYRQYALAIERALASADAGARETAFNSLLPELLQAEPASVVALFARQAPGEGRDRLRDEIASRWARQDQESAFLWIESLPDAVDRRAAATQAVRAIAAFSPEEALAAADRLGVGHDDGSVEHLVQRWAAEDPDAALRWLARQPADAQHESLRARIAAARAARSPPD
jgi:hypothetical protein